MDYISTRGQSPPIGFCDALLAGLAPDGGLYLPSRWPKVTPETIASFANRPYAEFAAEIVGRFVDGEIEPRRLAAMCAEAYGGFAHRAVTPLVQLGPNDWLLELFHGPTLAFKDLAMQLLARLMDHVLGERNRRATIVAATSGDTGSAAIEAFRSSPRCDVFILFPKGRVSSVQQRQMTGVTEPNVHAIAVEGSFDDCQAIVKALFGRDEFRRSVSLAAVNSINWARIVAQTVYYFAAASALGAPARPVRFTVPTGNFGDVFAGYVAREMGLPIERLVIATNRNDILARTFQTGRYEVRNVVPTVSPAMDIQVSSNFERLLAESYGRDGAAMRALMGGLSQSGSFAVADAPLARMKEVFSADRADEAETAATLKRIHDETGYLADPHTSVGLAVAARQKPGSGPMVTLATAHPAKFPDAVSTATGIRPELPPHLADLMSRKERYTTLGNDARAVEHYITQHARAASLEV